MLEVRSQRFKDFKIVCFFAFIDFEAEIRKFLKFFSEVFFFYKDWTCKHILSDSNVESQGMLIKFLKVVVIFSITI